MLLDIVTIKSHPQKRLITNGVEKGHIEGVVNNLRKLTPSKWAELEAIFHDLGKINPNFQDKLCNENLGYSNHAYLSAFAFYCAFRSVPSNVEILSKWLQGEALGINQLIAATVIIARHHGNLPDFSPEDKSGAGTHILSIQEILSLYNFINSAIDALPIDEFSSHYMGTTVFKHNLIDKKNQQEFLERFLFLQKFNTKPLDFFLSTQFSFASLIQSDKADAAEFENFIDLSRKNVLNFCSNFSIQLSKYLTSLNQNSDLNKLRTEIRNTSVENISDGLDQNKRVFELTAPTGSGKTLMMLSLAAEIIKNKGENRIIYALPFLSITEQVEAEVLNIFSIQKDFVQRVDSKSQNKRFEELQKELDESPDENKNKEIEMLEFQENTFAYPFVITTFVRFFETLLSNRNAELLKLPNFSNCIFLLDEIQALPPRLYGFLVAYLSEFCNKFNSYAIISTATQPNFLLPENHKTAKRFFVDYQSPCPILPFSYFEHPLFNRYKIIVNKTPIDLNILKEKILNEKQSVLVIVNTIDDSKELYDLLCEEMLENEVLLLNTHITPRHRKLKIYLAKRRLRENKRIILVSTQLIEAGVDIDFPVLYRDFATISSIVQSAGRCNRNGKLKELGKVFLFKLIKNGKIRSDIIYQGKDKNILQLTKDSLTEEFYEEKDLINIQRIFFNRIQSELNWGMHSQNSFNLEFDFMKDISECQFDKIGKFQLIDKQLFGEEVRCYVNRNKKDNSFNILLSLSEEIKELIKFGADKNKLRQKKRIIEKHLKKMSEQIVQVRLKSNHTQPSTCNEDYFDLKNIHPCAYSFEKGVDLKGEDNII